MPIRRRVSHETYPKTNVPVVSTLEEYIGYYPSVGTKVDESWFVRAFTAPYAGRVLLFGPVRVAVHPILRALPVISRDCMSIVRGLYVTNTMAGLPGYSCPGVKLDHPDKDKWIPAVREMFKEDHRHAPRSSRHTHKSGW